LPLRPDQIGSRDAAVIEFRVLMVPGGARSTALPHVFLPVAWALSDDKGLGMV
jgi:hypothetical protein